MTVAVSKKYLQPQVKLQNQNWCHERGSRIADKRWVVSYCFVHRQFLTQILGIEAAGKS